MLITFRSEAVISSYQRMAMLSRPTRLNLESAANWMHNNKPLIRPESGIFDDADDLVALVVNEDHGKCDELVEWLIEKCLPSKLTSLVSFYATNPNAYKTSITVSCRTIDSFTL